MTKSENLASLAKALVAAQKEMGAALKDAKNPFFKSKYADLNAIIDAAVPALNKNGIAVLQLPTTENGKSVLRTMLLHESGEMICSDTDIICAKPNDPQAMGSAISYARRYGLQASVALKAEDDDGNAGAGKAVNTTSGVTAMTTTASATVAATTTAAPATAKKVSFARKPAATVAASSGDDI